MDDTPKTIAEAYASPDVDDWKEAVHNEMDSILSNGTWAPFSLHPLPQTRQADPYRSPLPTLH